ncbi:MAG: glutaredoxin family protein [Thermodesulfovibrionales bacterium]|nr:glutaredoxin family protein [Thermodesulfovibrionales bacterium]
MKVNFYYKPGCWFCDQAEEMLNGLKDKYGLEVNKIDITENDELYELYRFDIPVIEFPDGKVLHGRIRKKELLEKIKEAYL